MPDFIPVLGYLDELIILPLAIMLVLRLIPPEIIVLAAIAGWFAISGLSVIVPAVAARAMAFSL